MTTSESNICFNDAEVEKTLLELEEDTKYMKEMFDKIEFIMEYINGDYDTWKGLSQSEFYKEFKTISGKFEGITDNLEKNNEFLRATIINYQAREKLINTNVDKNKFNLDIN